MSTLNTSPDPEKGSHHRNGYPSLAKWIAHDPDNESYVFRRFDKLSARNLLNLQSQLISLESELDRLDEAMWLSGNPDVILSMSRWESFKERAKDSTQPEHEKMELEQVLQGKIKQYRKTQIFSMTGVSKLLNLRQMKRYFFNPRFATSTDLALEFWGFSATFSPSQHLYFMEKQSTC
jgi:hypothetical protein